MPSVNTEAMNEHLQGISTQVSPSADAPELNPMENVWEYLRANKLSALVWNKDDAIVQACRDAWNFLIDDPGRIRSIGAREWACINWFAGVIRPPSEWVLRQLGKWRIGDSPPTIIADHTPFGDDYPG